MSLVRVLCTSVLRLYSSNQFLKLCPTTRVNPILNSKYCSTLHDEGKFVDPEEEGEEDDDEIEGETDEDEEEDEEVDIDDKEYEQLVPRNLRLPNSPHTLLVIQPKVKYGDAKTQLLKRTTPELQLQEACTLVESLDGWKVGESVILGTSSPTRKLVFGVGTNETIAKHVDKNKHLSGIFLSVNNLIGWKQAELEEMFRVPVFDRFSIVLHIFKERAKTKEAKLQLALAELPYVKSRLREAAKSGKEDISGAGGWFGSASTFYDKRIQIVKDRERKIKRLIAEIKVKRQVNREMRQKNKIPTVAVVGYTNSGKTSLIKSLTGCSRLVPVDKLFATLDVRLYAGRLDRIHHVLYIDTIGFISDIPTALIESFKATLEEVNLADLIIHVQDVSHPDLVNQRRTVYSTLKDMEINYKLLTTMTEVGNKIDKLDGDDVKNRRAEVGKSVDLLISATKETNLNCLKGELEKRLFVNMGCFMARVRVPTGGPEYSWLLRNAIIMSQEIDDSDQNFTLMDIRFTEATAGKFKKQFGISCIIPKRDIISSVKSRISNQTPAAATEQQHLIR